MAASEGLPLLHDASKLSPRSHAAAQAAAAQAQRQRRRKQIIGAILTVALVSAIAYVSKSNIHALDPSSPSADTINAIDAPYADVMADYRLTHDFDGVVQVSENGKPVFTDWSGHADEEFNVPMARDSIFPIGSNSKLFTSVALYQLQERGLVNLSDPVHHHLNATDFVNFGLPNQTTWCPRVAGAAPDSPCESITFVQLMHMGSGIGDSLNCDNVEGEYCHRSANNLVYYQGSLGPYIGMFINDPLVFKPDTGYSYSNPNYYLLSYMVEKLSGQSFEDYLSEHIFDKLGLDNTYYDPYSGVLGVRRGYVQQYVHYYAQATYEDPRELLATGTCAPYINSGAVSGSGGMRSTVDDMQRWYLDLFGSGGTKSKVLTPESVRMLVDRVNPVDTSYGQGILIRERRGDGWPSLLLYCGGMKCSVTCMAMIFKQEDVDKSAVISVFSNHMHYTFADREAFERFHPSDVMALPPYWGVIDDGGANALPTPLAREYLARISNSTTQ